MNHLAAMGMVLFMLSSFEALLPSMIAKLIYIGAVSGIYGLIMTEFGFMVPKAFFKDISYRSDSKRYIFIDKLSILGRF